MRPALAEFTWPDDWRTAARKVTLNDREAALVVQWLSEAREDHDDQRHEQGRHPWCWTCDVDLLLEDSNVSDALDLPVEMLESVDDDVQGRALRYLRLHGRPPKPTGVDPAPAFSAALLADIDLDVDDTPMRVADLIPVNASTLIVAQRKTGKTTLTLNLARCLITGTDFLARFPVQAITGRVGILNFEVSKAQLARWARDHQIPADRWLQVDLRDRRNPFAHPADLERLALILREHQVETLIVDTFARAYTGEKVSDSGMVSAFLTRLALWARADAGITDLILTTHAGWNGERSRDSSALEDWPDSIITMVANDDGQRFLHARGRDVDVDEDRLDYDTNSRTLTLSGAGSRRQTTAEARATHKATELAVYVRRAASQIPGGSLSQLGKAIRAMPDAPSFQDRDVSRAARLAVEQGFLRLVEEGPGKPTRAYPDTPSNPVQTPSRGHGPDDPVHPVQPRLLLDGVGGGRSGPPDTTTSNLDGVTHQQPTDQEAQEAS